MNEIVRTTRLVLRRHCLSDAAQIALYLNNYAVAGNLATVPYPYSLADAEWWLGRQKDDAPPEESGLAIELPGAGYIGNVGFHLTDGKPELGYWLAEPFWHRGIMSEAAAAAVAWYFALGRSDVIHSGVFHFNRASLAVQKKLGFTETGTSTRHCLARGEQVRHIDTQLSRGQWQGALDRVGVSRSFRSPARRTTAKDIA